MPSLGAADGAATIPGLFRSCCHFNLAELVAPRTRVGVVITAKATTPPQITVANEKNRASPPQPSLSFTGTGSTILSDELWSGITFLLIDFRILRPIGLITF